MRDSGRKSKNWRSPTSAVNAARADMLFGDDETSGSPRRDCDRGETHNDGGNHCISPTDFPHSVAEESVR